MTPTPPSLLHTRNGSHALTLREARGFWSRFRGLMLSRPLPPDSGLLITHCASVHTCFMRYALDLVYLDAAGRVTQCVAHLKPWRTSACNRRSGLSHGRAVHVLELAAGSIERLGIQTADQLKHPTLGGAAT